ncbi:AAA domain-containing protein [Motilibacter peucedani]|uniref:AAA domain-containing protein n=1 Tax=Motilibacter peucedani TaxID=598650 RepID=A0A420XRN6_9ACTN|nr:NERD domain-containing protein [Motilibacter peucedani]RKS77500.1 AAA domain-containing protein [Motilibacter peucedani]
MPRCLPEHPNFTTTSEKVAWEAVRAALGPDDVLVSNLRITDETQDYEADLVVILPGFGTVVVEVKGGNVYHDGQNWRTTARDAPIDPVNQALRAKHALQRYLSRDPRWGRGRTRMAHMVCFPFTDLPQGFRRPNAPRYMMLDRGNLTADPGEWLRQVLRRQDSENPEPDHDTVADIVEILAGRMLPQPSLLAEMREREAQVELLTERQAVIIGALGLLPRVEVLGGAGSGKTWLAVEQAKRLAKDGKRVALVCYSRGLAAFMDRRVATFDRRHRPAYVGTFHDLGLQWGAQPGADDDSDYWERRLSQEMLERAAEQKKGRLFDAIIVDEAQDFADSWWPALLAGLKDEEQGRLFVFADEGQRVFARQGRAPVSLVPIMLEENLRNTKPIARTFGSLTSLPMRTRGGEGAPVRFVSCSAEDALSVADDQIDVLLEEGWSPEHVALLTTGKRHPEQTERQAAGQKEYWESFWDKDQVFYGHVLGFKGLERPAVVLALNGFGKDRAKEKLYVALSRARDLLVVCGDPKDISEIGGESVLRSISTPVK